MGVTYKLRDEVVHFIISQRQSNPLYSCRQLAESASQKFQLNLSKSSVHDVLKENGIITPRGRKPKDKFEIPQEKKKQIQSSLSQVKLIAPPEEARQEKEAPEAIILPPPAVLPDLPAPPATFPADDSEVVSPEYKGAGRIFLKAVLWDLGIFSEKSEDSLPGQSQISLPVLKDADWCYYLTYSKGIKVSLENNKSIFIDLPLPLERCIREVADGIINNVKPLIVHQISDEILFKACMEAQHGFKIENISIMDHEYHVLLEFSNIVELNRKYLLVNRIFVESYEKDFLERTKNLFLSQDIDNINLIENLLNLRGFDTISKNDNIVTLLIGDNYDNRILLQEAVEKLNGMYLRDEQNRSVKVKIQVTDPEEDFLKN